jgi:hypothetical protein
MQLQFLMARLPSISSNRRQMASASLITSHPSSIIPHFSAKGMEDGEVEGDVK